MSNTDKYIPEKILKRPPCWWNWNSQPGCIYVRLKSKILRQYWYLKSKILQRLSKFLFGFGRWMSFEYYAYVFPGINLLVKCSTFLVKMTFICMRMKNHFSTSKAEDLTSFWDRGPGELGNGLLLTCNNNNNNNNNNYT